MQNLQYVANEDGGRCCKRMKIKLIVSRLNVSEAVGMHLLLISRAG